MFERQNKKTRLKAGDLLKADTIIQTESASACKLHFSIRDWKMLLKAFPPDWEGQCNTGLVLPSFAYQAGFYEEIY